MRPEPTRLVESEGELGEALRRLSEPPLLTDAQVERVQLAVAGLSATSLLPWLLAKGAPLKIFIFASAVAVGTLTTKLVIEEMRAARTPPAPSPGAASPTPQTLPRDRVLGLVAEELPAVVEPLPVTQEASPVVALRRPFAAVRSAPSLEPVAPIVEPVVEPVVETNEYPMVREPARPAAEVAGAPVPESEEVWLLEQAHLARQGADVARALQQLELYRARFPRGVLRAEATLLEVEVRLLNNDELKALTLLDEALPEQSSRHAEFSLIRSELLARLQRCEEALPGFGELLEARPALQERAWIGWATCQSAIGQKAAAREALTAYLQRFPRGAQRQAALELLKED